MPSSAATTPLVPRRPILVIAVVLTLLGLLAPPAMAHTELEPGEAPAGSTQTLTFHVAYEGSATTGLDVQLPEGASVVEVPDKPGWTSTNDDSKRTVSWSGGPAAEDVELAVVVKLPDTTGVVLFPAIQKTVDGEVEWISPEEGEGEGTNPAPRMTLTADHNASTTTTAASTTTDDLPSTTVEASNEGDGDPAAPWLIGAGIAAVVAIALGGWFLKGRMDADRAQGGDGPPPGPDGSGGG